MVVSAGRVTEPPSEERKTSTETMKNKICFFFSISSFFFPFLKQTVAPTTPLLTQASADGAQLDQVVGFEISMNATSYSLSFLVKVVECCFCFFVFFFGYLLKKMQGGPPSRPGWGHSQTSQIENEKAVLVCSPGGHNQHKSEDH